MIASLLLAAVVQMPSGIRVSTRVDSGFWRERLDVNAKVTSKAVLDWADRIGAVENFKAAAEGRKNCHKGLQFTDAGLFQAVEGAARILSERSDPALRERVTEIVGWICRAQEPDGYLYTPRTVGPTDANTGTNRWSNLKMSHELYQCGHLYEAAVAWWRATGDKRLLETAKKNAELLCRTIGLEEEQRRIVAGHEELKLGLLSLAEATGDERYARLAKLEADLRGRADLRELLSPYNGDRTYAQDHLPLRNQCRAEGHCVRAGYLYAAMGELVRKGLSPELSAPLHAIWDDAVRGKTYLTGGVGSRHATESFGVLFELPNDFAYNETCASIAMAQWHHRMFTLDHDAKYVDMLERVVYNGVLPGVSLSGDHFFYQNPLQSSGGLERFRHHWCNCCPPNVVRFLPQIPQFAVDVDGREVFVNMVMDCSSTIALGNGKVVLEERTDYPFDGRIRLKIVSSTVMGGFSLNLRIPSWVSGMPIPGGPYRYMSTLPPASVSCNGQQVDAERRKNGYVVVDRVWKRGDVVELVLPMNVRRVVADDRVADDLGCLAFERGPLVYCAEACDNDGRVLDRVVPDGASLKNENSRFGTRDVPSFLVSSTCVWKGYGLPGTSVVRESKPLRFIPYFLWANREEGEMAVWFPTAEEDVRSRARPSASSCAPGMTVAALNDGRVSNQWFDGCRNFAFVENKTEQWVQYSFPSPERINGVEIDWGIIRLWRQAAKTPPVDWRVIGRASSEEGWRAIADGSSAKNEDAVSRLEFQKPVWVDKIRIVVSPGDPVPAGIREWKLF